MRFLSIVFALTFLFIMSGCATNTIKENMDSPYRNLDTLEMGQILHLPTGKLLSEAEMMEFLARYPVVYVGESHDSVQDHAVQLAILKYFNEKFPGEVAVGMEMFQRPAQSGLDAYISGKTDDRAFAKLFYQNWGGLYPYYREITDYARSNAIPLVALNADKGLRMEVRKKGLDGLSAEMKENLPEMDRKDPYHKALIKAYFGKHVKGPKELENFYNIQVLWDETMARSGAEYIRKNKKRLLIFAGGAHVSYGLGIPRRLFRRLPLPYAIVSTQAVEVADEKKKHIMDIETPPIPLLPVDIVLGVRYEGLEGKQARLGVTIENAHPGGVGVTGVSPGSPAEKAGIVKGDVIISMDGIELNEPFDLTYQIGLRSPGESGKVEVLRDNKRVKLEVMFFPFSQVR